MRTRLISFPLYLHIALLAVALVIAAAVMLRWFGDLIPGWWEFGLMLGIIAAVALAMSYRMAAPLKQLAIEAAAVRRFDFSDHPIIRSEVREIDELSAGFDLMRDAVRRFLRINQRLATESDFSLLRPWLLDKLVDIAEARGGVLYLADATSGALTATAQDTSGGQASGTPTLPSLAIQRMPQLLATAANTMRAASGQLDAEELTRLGLNANWVNASALAVPLRDRQDQLLGMLLLFKDVSIAPANASFIEALAASAATTLETQGLLQSQKALIDATIRMLAGAIDAKSPYTGAHCARVPELALMLARAACAANEGPFSNYQLNREQWEELTTAAWLHDCGKVSVPEYVVDKATKLEALYNRIHEIRMRFEVLKRDADIAYWRGVAQGGDASTLATQRDALHATLDDEFAFVANCNIGGEFMGADKRERLAQISARTWQRTLDDRLGLSRDETARMPAASALPAIEPLLSDRPEHRIPRTETQQFDADNRWGFAMDVPELQFNRGELHNLGISRGTLTDEDRFIINAHMVYTITMLTELPLPRHLQRVPEIAGGHHEKLDGTGYPCRRDATQLSTEARMLAIADIFEALTAKDRPYKPGKTLSESLSIMAKMRSAAHIDPELFELFLRSGVYLDYAKRFMAAEQIDAVEVDAYL